eukprot:gnl/TRDRNA2_/TRDRNA2_68556_c0_seq1.p1 gnl/TRDRNA2_/TRDRNA2_68556_c0~~gnl/TRDRNA2_/TRDRNA2_68556_c0_seq1.p1  ORF type:complete len:354 (+),score=36.13 gnl/TRDRNA2_/TRDRNA2_68556_c0_seq1:47-1108(+)
MWPIKHGIAIWKLRNRAGDKEGKVPPRPLPVSTNKASWGPLTLDGIRGMHQGDLFYAGLGLVVWYLCWPGQEAEVWAVRWVAMVVLRNLIINCTIYEAWHQLLFGCLANENVSRMRYSEKSPYEDGGATLRRERFHTTCGFLMSSAYECLIAHLWASGAIAPCGSSSDTTSRLPGCRLADPFHLPVAWWPYFVLAFPLMTQFRGVHFFFVHRSMHPWWSPKKGMRHVDVGAFLYRHVHSLHHKSHNPGPWSSLSMHPVEHLFYFSGTLIALLLPLHPLHLLLMKYHTDISALAGHDGYGEPGANDVGHYLHHTKFECNYGPHETSGGDPAPESSMQKGVRLLLLIMCLESVLL